MADKIPSDVRSLTLSLHTDLTTLNAYANNPAMVATLAGLIREKLATIRGAIDDVAGTPDVVAPRGWDRIESGVEG